MRFALFNLASCLSLALAAPPKDYKKLEIEILNFALTLEHLEATFYAQALAKFDDADFKAAKQPDYLRDRITEIGLHESQHVQLLTAAIKQAGGVPVAPCKYNFPLNDVPTFLLYAQLLEFTGTSAYTGAAKYLVNSADYLTVAASILAIEAKHTAWISSVGRGEDPFPSDLQAPLDLNEVYSLASMFIVSCPKTNPKLPFKVLPGLTLTKATDKTGKTDKSPLDLSTGDLIFLTPAKKLPKKKQVYANFIQLPQAISIPFKLGQGVAIPAGVYGPTYVILSTKPGAISDKYALTEPIIINIPLPPTDFGIQKVLKRSEEENL